MGIPTPETSKRARGEPRRNSRPISMHLGEGFSLRCDDCNKLKGDEELHECDWPKRATPNYGTLGLWRDHGPGTCDRLMCDDCMVSGVALPDVPQHREDEYCRRCWDRYHHCHEEHQRWLQTSGANGPEANIGSLGLGEDAP